MSYFEEENTEEENEEESSEEEENEEENTEEEEELTPEEMKAENARLQKQLKKTNSESAQRRIELKDLKKKEKERDEAELGELELAQKQASDLEKENATTLKRLRTHDLRRSFTVMAGKMDVQFSSPQAVDDAFALAQPLLDDVEVDDDGNVQSKAMKAVVKEVLDGRDYLVGKTKKGPGDIDAGKRGSESIEASDEEIMKAKTAQVDYSSL